MLALSTNKLSQSVVFKKLKLYFEFKELLPFVVDRHFLAYFESVKAGTSQFYL